MNDAIADSEKAETYWLLGDKGDVSNTLFKIAQRINQSWIPCMEVGNKICHLIRTFLEGKDKLLIIILR
jgi:hypothetical protein